ncbi:hypothetical protein G3N92_32635 [Burkholderia sp. Ac-20379]|nr:hypothetical protein [Burkholderia sp. Ac-20379]
MPVLSLRASSLPVHFAPGQGKEVQVEVRRINAQRQHVRTTAPAFSRRIGRMHSIRR